MSVVTRFAPSPTGYLHIGGARTALFNWLFARRMGGRYLLRIEDTDRARSTQAAIDAILNGLDWLGLQHDGEITYQFARAARHRVAAEEMIARGTAFRCFCTPDELERHRAAMQRWQLQAAAFVSQQGRELGNAPASELDSLASIPPDVIGLPGSSLRLANYESRSDYLRAVLQLVGTAFRSPYRDGKQPPSANASYVVRLRAPDADEVLNDDLVQGPVRIKAREIDDLVLLRADGNPTYMLSVVVDDHDMGVTHVIRGDDHLTNAARQIPIFHAMGWTAPKFAHVPLIHGEDGKKLSKRHGSLAVHEWRDMGYLPEAMNAYLMRLGWSPGHDDILSKEQAAPQFDLGQIGRGPARLDFAKLDSVNAHFLKDADDTRIERLILDFIAAHRDWSVPQAARSRIAAAVPLLKKRAKTLAELADMTRFLVAERPLAFTEAALALIDPDMKTRLTRLSARLAETTLWENAALAALLKAFATDEGVGMGKIGPGLRAALTGGSPAPDLGQSMELLGREETLARLADRTR